MKKRTDKIIYKNPAEAWTQALPMGNGRLGVMVYGGVNHDLIPLNEETIWKGDYSDKNNYKATAAVPKIRELIFAGRIDEATNLAGETMISVPDRFDSYQPLGELEVVSADVGDYWNYKRELDLTGAITVVSYQKYRQNDRQKSHYKQEYFVSAVDQVVAVRYSCDTPEGINLKISYTRKENGVSHPLDDGIEVFGQVCENGVSFYSAVKILPEGGNLRIWEEWNGAVHAEFGNADSITLLVAANSDYRGEDPKTACLETLRKACEKGYDKIKEDHIDNYRHLYERFSIEIDEEETEEVIEEETEEATSEWLQQVKMGQISPEFAALYMNYQRYLLISDSRPGCLPANLQGVWNDQYCAMWESDYHLNINLQMNYMPAEGYNLGECCEPLFDWLETLVEPGSKTAKLYYNAGGWVVHHVSDIFGYTAPNCEVLGIWPMGNAWLCRHLYEHYLYTYDKEFLREKAYPLIKGTVRFLLDFMVEAPEGTVCPGCLVTNPSHSPENAFYTPEGTIAKFTYSATMDTEIIYDALTACLDIIDELGKEESTAVTGKEFEKEFKDEIVNALSKLPPVKVSARTGGIQEWAEDFEETDIGHRHVSHLYGVYPGKMILPEKNPVLASAAKRSLERKLESDYDGQGWSLSWIACLWARLGEAQKAYEALQTIFKRHIMYNLMIDAHGYPQVGDAQGVPAAILEMLAQSHDDKIVLLPALPKEWRSGSVCGMKLRHGYTLDMSWKAGKLVQAILYKAPFGKRMSIEIGTEGEYERKEENGNVYFTAK